VIPRFWGVRVGRCPSWKIVTTRPEFACCAALGRNVPGWVLSCPVRGQRVGRGLRLSVTGLAGSRDLGVSSAVVALDHRVERWYGPGSRPTSPPGVHSHTEEGENAVDLSRYRTSGDVPRC
jgi:hypothetical protein